MENFRWTDAIAFIVTRIENLLGLHTWMEYDFKGLIATRGFLHPNANSLIMSWKTIS